MLGAAGCGPLANSLTQVPEEYLPSGGSRMNVILVIIDSLRRDHLGVYGNDWIKTPNLDALAGESLRFDRSYPESLPTILARRAIARCPAASERAVWSTSSASLRTGECSSTAAAMSLWS